MVVVPVGGTAAIACVIVEKLPVWQLPTQIVVLAAWARGVAKHAIKPAAAIVIVRSNVFVLIKVSSMDFLIC